MSYRALVVGAGLLSALSVVRAQSACGLQGFSSCTDETSGRTVGYGCCPVGFECYATECSYTGTATSTAPAPEKTECPGFPAHHLCPESSGGGCCYTAHACDPENASQCILTQTERVFDDIITITTVKNGKTEITHSITVYYPWPTVESRVTPSGGPSQTTSDIGYATATASDTTDELTTKTSVITVTNPGEPETTPPPASQTGGDESSSTSTSTSAGSSSSAVTAAAGNLQARVGAVLGGLVAGLMV